MAGIRGLLRHQPGAGTQEQCGHRRSCLGNAGSSPSRSRFEGNGYRTLTLGLGEKITDARFRYLMPQCDICSKHGGRCLPWGNPHLSAIDFQGSLSGEPICACAPA